MKVGKALLYSLLVVIVSVVLLTIVHGLPTQDQLIKGSIAMFVIAFVIIKFFCGDNLPKEKKNEFDNNRLSS